MSGEVEAVTETAKAVQETAKLGVRALDSGDKLVVFLGRIFGDAADQVGGLLGDKLRYMRAERQLRYMAKYEEQVAKQGVRSIEAAVAVPILEAGMLEFDDSLQDMWAAMLANATDPNGSEVRRSFTAILKQLDPFDAAILNKLYEVDCPLPFTTISTYGLPEEAPIDVGDPTPRDYKPGVQLSIRNLIRVGCIEPGAIWPDGQVISSVSQNPLGEALVAACRRPDPIGEAR